MDTLRVLILCNRISSFKIQFYVFFNLFYPYFGIRAGSFCWHCHWTIQCMNQNAFYTISLICYVVWSDSLFIVIMKPIPLKFHKRVFDATVLYSAFGLLFFYFLFLKWLSCSRASCENEMKKYSVRNSFNFHIVKQ